MTLQNCNLLQHANVNVNSKVNITCSYFTKCLQKIVEEAKKSECCEDNILVTQEVNSLSYTINDKNNNETLTCNEDINLNKYYNLGKYIISKCNETIIDKIKCFYYDLISTESSNNDLTPNICSEKNTENDNFYNFESIVKTYEDRQQDAWFYNNTVLFIKSCLLFSAIFGILILFAMPYLKKRKLKCKDLEI
ncbi:hypothetical protein NAPIS_ORF02201 [Vairimorpha apis BRL 01]|uniref:Uncharacterized protein n=1 Tax=Vairimorpha apis BRL 01 TaxID=1037528 RepID=T0MA25_9MICR|nr:hypothetical protein NAPIS_ORF02201 [Vairimorpha apis BRL 01]